MTITGQSSLAKDDIERMVHDAESHAEEDRRRRDEAEVRNTADTLVYQTEKLLKDQGDKFEREREGGRDVCTRCGPQALAGTDIEAIKTATEKLGDHVPELLPAPLRAGCRRQPGDRRSLR